MNLLINKDLINASLSIAAFIISIIALIYTIKSFILKSGLNIRCRISISSDIDCNDKFISSIILENIKDRATIIFKIYLKLEQNVYIEVEDFSEKPLILKPFEVYYKEYDPILFYSSGNEFVKIDHLIDNSKIKRNIILSTTQGKYRVKTDIPIWDAILISLKNYYTLVAMPRRLEYKGKSYGENIRYLIDFVYSDGENRIIPIHKRDEYNKVFKNIDLTGSSLKTEKNLYNFLLEQKDAGNLSFNSVKVIDITEWIEKNKKFYKTVYKAEACGYFEYYIIGKIVSKIRDLKLKRKNNELRNRRRKSKNK